MDFTNIQYLQKGTLQQQKVYRVLKQLLLFDDLAKFKPVLVGTYPIDIVTENSDLDIVCQCKNHRKFYKIIKELYSTQTNFSIKILAVEGIKTTIAKFEYKGYIIEIFGQDLPYFQQNAYKHMLIEKQILEEKGKLFL